jgi:hypothetical protein
MLAGNIPIPRPHHYSGACPDRFNVFADRGKIKRKARKLTTKIWKMKDENRGRPGGGSLGSGWIRVSPGLGETGPPPPEKGGPIQITPAFRGPAKAGVCRLHPALLQGPKHPADRLHRSHVLTTPLFHSLILTVHRVYGLYFLLTKLQLLPSLHWYVERYWSYGPLQEYLYAGGSVKCHSLTVRRNPDLSSPPLGSSPAAGISVAGQRTGDGPSMRILLFTEGCRRPHVLRNAPVGRLTVVEVEHG